MSSGINLYNKISKLPIIKCSSTRSVSSYLGIENKEMVTQADELCNSGTGYDHHWATSWWPGISPANALTCTAVVQISQLCKLQLWRWVCPLLKTARDSPSRSMWETNGSRKYPAGVAGDVSCGGDLRLNQTLKCELLTWQSMVWLKDCSVAVQPWCTNDELPAEHFPGHSKCNAK